MPFKTTWYPLLQIILVRRENKLFFKTIFYILNNDTYSKYICRYHILTIAFFSSFVSQNLETKIVYENKHIPSIK